MIALLGKWGQGGIIFGMNPCPHVFATFLVKNESMNSLCDPFEIDMSAYGKAQISKGKRLEELGGKRSR